MDLIFDIGANAGQNLDYYLKKAAVVVAVEANPVLTEHIAQRYNAEIDSGRLKLVSAVLTLNGGADPVNFYVHKHNPVLSRFPVPPVEQSDDYTATMLPQVGAAELVERYGKPNFLKIDVEHYDEAILRAFFDLGVYPDYVSAEAHSAAVFCTLVSRGGYSAFQLQSGRSVDEQFKGFPIQTRSGEESFDFVAHSAGPCTDDLPGEWMTTETFLRLLALEGFGWKDIHATRVETPNRHAVVHLQPYALRAVRRRLEKLPITRALMGWFGQSRQNDASQ